MAVPYTISLQDGWNTISFPGVLEQGRLSDVLPSTVSFVLAYRDGKWVSAIWNENAWQGGLEQVEAGYGYWVYSTGFCDVNAVLAPLEDYRPTLLEGWNLIGCVDKHLQPAGDCTGDMLTLDEYLDGLEWQSAYTLQRHIRVLDDEPPEIPRTAASHCGVRRHIGSLLEMRRLQNVHQTHHGYSKVILEAEWGDSSV